MTERRHPNIVNIDEVETRETNHGPFRHVEHQLAHPAGAQQLGGCLMTLPPGARAWPFHYHCANEEAIYIVSGTGTTRIGEQRIPVRAGDWISYVVGPEHPHQLINDGATPLVYLCISTTHTVEVVGYPDSKKVAMRAG